MCWQTAGSDFRGPLANSTTRNYYEKCSWDSRVSGRKPIAADLEPSHDQDCRRAIQRKPCVGGKYRGGAPPHSKISGGGRQPHLLSRALQHGLRALYGGSGPLLARRTGERALRRRRERDRPAAPDGTRLSLLRE